MLMNDPTDTETSRLTAHYAGLLARYGDDPRSLDWGSGASQAARFAVLAGIGDLRGTTILDVGCGLADFHAWLLDRGIAHRYVGLDLTPEMATRAAERFPEADILCGDIAADARLAPGPSIRLRQRHLRPANPGARPIP
jgi:SAM-dependent methyltransferase